MNSVPENWIQFIAVRGNGSNRAIELQRASHLRNIEGDNLAPAKIKPGCEPALKRSPSGNVRTAKPPAQASCDLLPTGRFRQPITSARIATPSDTHSLALASVGVWRKRLRTPGGSLWPTTR